MQRAPAPGARPGRGPAADLATLAELGRAQPPPRPRERAAPPRPGRAQPQAGTHETMLLDALQDAGLRITPRETAAITAVAALDTTTVGAVVQWIRHSPPALLAEPETGPKK
ncbi:hypothetical protein ACLIYM_25065 [Streptomyces fenghuangensis]